MALLACVLSLLACQPPAAREGAYARLGIDAEAAAAAEAWKVPAPRVASIAPAALVRRVQREPLRAAPIVEDCVRAALVEIRPLAVLREASTALCGPGKARERDVPARLDVRAFEDLVERVYRDVVVALGSGREPANVAPVLQAALDAAFAAGSGELDRGAADRLRQACDRAGKVDLDALRAAAATLIRAALVFAESRQDLLRQPASPGGNGVTGSVLFDRVTPFGRLVVGGDGANEYRCELLAIVIDLGGDDVYRGPAAATTDARRMSLVLDLAGNDRYEANNDALGSATFGLAVLLDLEGDDVYRGAARCAGYGAAGIGVLCDLGGDDELHLARDGGGVGCMGLGVYLDTGAGKDRARFGPRTLGCGLPGGVGMFVDDGGDDERTALDDGGVTFACGAGLGLRPWLAGGAGLFLDAAGNDRCVASDACCGAGADGGLGVCFDVAGDDQWTAGMLALGGARDHGFGVFFDLAGADRYRVQGAGLGSACARSVASAEDRAGDDEYDLEGAWPGSAEGGALGLFVDAQGSDTYRVRAAPVPWPACAPVRSVALSVHEDRGGADDVFEVGDGVPPRGNGMDERKRLPGVAGEVLRVFLDH